MPIPPQFQKGGDKGPPTDAPKVSVSEALSVLESHANSPRAHSALKTLRSELEDGGSSPAKKPGSTTNAKQEALARLKG